MRIDLFRGERTSRIQLDSAAATAPVAIVSDI
jgi:hypothetical protein